MAAFRELVALQVTYHHGSFHTDEYAQVEGPFTTWFRQPDNRLNTLLSRALKFKFLRANPHLSEDNVSVTSISIRGAPLLKHELNTAPLAILQMNDTVDVFMKVKEHDSQPLEKDESPEMDSESQFFEDSQKTLEDESLDLLSGH